MFSHTFVWHTFLSQVVVVGTTRLIHLLQLTSFKQWGCQSCCIAIPRIRFFSNRHSHFSITLHSHPSWELNLRSGQPRTCSCQLRALDYQFALFDKYIMFVSKFGINSNNSQSQPTLRPINCFGGKCNELITYKKCDDLIKSMLCFLKYKSNFQALSKI